MAIEEEPFITDRDVSKLTYKYESKELVIDVTVEYRVDMVESQYNDRETDDNEYRIGFVDRDGTMVVETLKSSDLMKYRPEKERYLDPRRIIEMMVVVDIACQTAEDEGYDVERPEYMAKSGTELVEEQLVMEEL